jgi:hypothetical protein
MENLILTTENQLKGIIKNSVSEALELYSLKERPKKDELEKLDLEQTADFCGTTKQTIINWTNKGLIKKYKIGKKTFYFKNEILEAMRNNPKLNK